MNPLLSRNQHCKVNTTDGSCKIGLTPVPAGSTRYNWFCSLPPTAAATISVLPSGASEKLAMPSGKLVKRVIGALGAFTGRLYNWLMPSGQSRTYNMPSGASTGLPGARIFMNCSMLDAVAADLAGGDFCCGATARPRSHTDAV